MRRVILFMCSLVLALAVCEQEAAASHDFVPPYSTNDNCVLYGSLWYYDGGWEHRGMGACYWDRSTYTPPQPWNCKGTFRGSELEDDPDEAFLKIWADHGYDVVRSAGYFERCGTTNWYIYGGNLTEWQDVQWWIYGEEDGDYLSGTDDGTELSYQTNLRLKLYGNSGNDALYGTWNRDWLYGNYGDDFIRGWDGDDYIEGGKDKDKIYGGDGDDEIYGDWPTIGSYCSGSCQDCIYGEDGEDVIYGGAHYDKIHGGDDDDDIYGNYGGCNKIHGGNHGTWGDKCYCINSGYSAVEARAGCEYPATHAEARCIDDYPPDCTWNGQACDI